MKKIVLPYHESKKGSALTKEEERRLVDWCISHKDNEAASNSTASAPFSKKSAAGLKRRGLDIGDDIYTVGYAAGRLAEVLRERNRNES